MTDDRQRGDDRDEQRSDQRDRPSIASTRNFDTSEGPGPQGERAPQGGEWSAGYAHEPDPDNKNPSEHAWGEGPGHPEPGEENQVPVERSPTTPARADKDDILAVVLSAILPGIGQVTLGQTTKGFVVFLIAIPTFFGFGLYNIAAAIDAYCVAMASKRRTVGDWEFFPDFSRLFGRDRKETRSEQ